MTNAICDGLHVGWKEGLIRGGSGEEEVADVEDDSWDAEQFKLLGVVESHDFKGILENIEFSFLRKATALTFNRRHSERSSTPSICSLVLFRKSYFSGLSSSNRRSTVFSQISTSTWRAKQGAHQPA